MQAVHRKFGKFMKRSADDSQVAVLLKDFDDADKLLTKVHSLPTLCYFKHSVRFILSRQLTVNDNPDN